MTGKKQGGLDMESRLFCNGNEAIGWGAIEAGALYFFGYPITPQNEIPEFFAKELPKRGGAFLQSQDETASSNMVYAASGCGVRALTSTSSPGWALMQEGFSNAVNAELPCVFVLVQRGGPGSGTTQHAQMDYMSATRGGGQGGYKNIVLAPSSVQESHDLIQLAFYLADKYRNPVVVLSDAIVALMQETLHMKKLDFGPLPEKDWAMRGKAKQKDGRHRMICCTQGVMAEPPYPDYLSFITHLIEKYKLISETEVRYELYKMEDAQLALVAFGYVSRVCKEAVDLARKAGLKVGLIRPITLWPFPSAVIREISERVGKVLVVEDNMGLMVDDVRTSVEGCASIHLLNMLCRHTPVETGMILPDRVLAEIKRLV